MFPDFVLPRLAVAAAFAVGTLTAAATAFGYQPEPNPISAPAAGQRHQIYAPPMFYGPWRTVKSHGGKVWVEVAVSPIGDTMVAGEIRYWKTDGERVVKPFHGETAVRTGNVWGDVEVRLKGVPTGCSCWIDVK